MFERRGVHGLAAPPWRRRGRGFTMVELMVTLVVLAILLAIAAPNLSSFVSSSRLRATQGELVSALTLARSEATKRGRTVVVAALAPTTGQEFSAGWQVFEDANDNNFFDTGEVLVRTYPAPSGNQRFGTVGGETAAAFNARGFLKTATTIDFRLCGKLGETIGYRVRLEPIGLADVKEDRALCT
jgi:type IV fimbrial biogenesis protein FimT